MPKSKKVFMFFLKLIPIIIGSILVRIGFEDSKPILMVIGLFIIGVCLILYLRKLQPKMMVLLVTFAVVPLVAISWSFVHQFDVENLNTISHSLKLISQKQTQQINDWINKRDYDLGLIANNSSLEDNTINSHTKNLINNIKNSNDCYEEIFILDSSNNILFSTNKSQNTYNISFSKTIKDLSVSDVVSENNNPYIYMKKDTGGKIVGCKLNLSDIAQINKLEKLPDYIPNNTVNTFIVNKQGQIIFSSQEETGYSYGSELDCSVNSYLDKMDNKKMHYKNCQGSRKVGAYTTIDDLGWHIISEQSYSELINTIHERSFMNPYAILGLTLLMVAIFTAIFSVGMTKQFVHLKDLMLKGTQGDLNVNFEKSKFNIIKIKEIDKMTDTFNKMIKTIRELNESNEAKMKEQSQTMSELSHANEIAESQQEELEELYENLKSSNEKLEEAYEEMRTTQSNLLQHEDQIVSNISDINELSSDISNEMKDSLQVVNEGNQTIEETSNQMERISEKVGSLSDFIQDLQKYSQNIYTMNNTINYIANRTRLLALNASIEASKAGADGAGFSVIAEEVNKLSVQSADASKQISDLIKHVIDNIESIVKEMNEGLEEVKRGTQKTRMTKEVFDKITQSMEKISTGINDINQNTKEIADTSKEFKGYLKEVNKNVDHKISSNKQ